MADGAPVLGIIAAPALGLIWRGIVGRGAERLAICRTAKRSPPKPIHARPRPASELIVLVSRSHLEARTQAFLDGLPEAKRVPCGSAVKFCRLAEGSADLYPRLAPTQDWDVAAGHAIVAAAGGRMVAPDGAAARLRHRRSSSFRAFLPGAIKRSGTEGAQDFRPFAFGRGAQAFGIGGELFPRARS